MGRGHETKLECGRSWLGIKKACAFSFTKVHEVLEQVCRDIVDCLLGVTLSFKIPLDKTLISPIWFALLLAASLH